MAHFFKKLFVKQLDIKISNQFYNKVKGIILTFIFWSIKNFRSKKSKFGKMFSLAPFKECYFLRGLFPGNGAHHIYLWSFVYIFPTGIARHCFQPSFWHLMFKIRYKGVKKYFLLGLQTSNFILLQITSVFWLSKLAS